MTNIRYIDKEEYAAKAIELFEQERESFVRFVYECLSDGAAFEYTREQLVKTVEKQLEQALFNHLKRAGIVQGSVRHDYTLGYCRKKRTEPRMSDVPSELLNISEVLKMSGALPKFDEVIESVLMDARKLILVEAIEATASKATGISSGNETEFGDNNI